MKNQSGIWFVVAVALLYGVLAIMAGSASISSLSGPANFFALMLACVAVLWVHELGHILAACLVGLKVLGVNLWPFFLDLRKTPKWQLGALGHWLNDGAFLLRGPNGARSKLLISLFGGWIASVALAVWAYQIQIPYEWHKQSFWNLPSNDIGLWMYVWVQFLGFTFWLSAGYLIFQMFPLRDLSPTWDGAFVFDLLRGGEPCRRAINHFAFRSESLDKRPRDWDTELLAACREDKPMIDRLNWICGTINTIWIKES